VPQLYRSDLSSTPRLSALQEAYLKQYMAQVELIQQRSAAARAGTLDAQEYQDLKDLKTELAIAKGILPKHSHTSQKSHLLLLSSCAMSALAAKVADSIVLAGIMRMPCGDLHQKPWHE